MPTIDSALREIREIARRTDRIREAEKRLFEVIASAPAVQLVESESLIRKTVDEVFFPKRRAALHEHLDRSLIGTGRPRSQPVQSIATDALTIFKSEVQAISVELAD